MGEKETILETAKKFHEIGDLYEELATLTDCEETQENEEKLATLTGKLIFKIVEIEKINF